MKFVDMRSDTVTKPSPGMLKAMQEAPLGDDVYGEDPTINLLQERLADMFGMEAGLMVASGTMSNQICLAASTRPGCEVICAKGAHIYRFEGAAASIISGLSFRPIIGDGCKMRPEDIPPEVNSENIHHPRTALVALENSADSGQGRIYGPDEMAAIHSVAKEHGLGMHLDGARVFNACVAGGISPAEVGKYFDTISVCFSKGLGAPVGSVMLGSKDHVAEALYVRKRMGGAMRQAGILAAAMLYALDNNVERLAEDHRRAKELAKHLQNLPGCQVDIAQVETNVVSIDIAPSGRSQTELMAELKGHGLLIGPFGPNLRAITHLDINDADLALAKEAFSKVLD